MRAGRRENRARPRADARESPRTVPLRGSPADLWCVLENWWAGPVAAQDAPDAPVGSLTLCRTVQCAGPVAVYAVPR